MAAVGDETQEAPRSADVMVRDGVVWQRRPCVDGARATYAGGIDLQCFIERSARNDDMRVDKITVDLPRDDAIDRRLDCANLAGGIRVLPMRMPVRPSIAAGKQVRANEGSDGLRTFGAPATREDLFAKRGSATPADGCMGDHSLAMRQRSAHASPPAQAQDEVLMRVTRHAVATRRFPFTMQRFRMGRQSNGWAG
jgi:hypothetical protein